MSDRGESLVRLVVILLMATAPAACAEQQHPLTAIAAASLKGRRITTTVRPPTAFFLAKTESAPLPSGLVVGFAVLAAQSDGGARILRQNGIADPASHIARQLGNDLQHRYALKLTQPSVYISDDDPKQIASRHPEADLILDVWICDWTLAQLPHEPLKYRMSYTVNLRLIDTKVAHAIDGTKGSVIADGTCRYLPEETPNAPTYDAFLADGARRLKDELDAAALSCLQKLRSKVLSADLSP